MAKHLSEQRLELYPALHQLVTRGRLKAEWGVSEANQGLGVATPDVGVSTPQVSGAPK